MEEIEIIKLQEEKIQEYRKLYAQALLVREKDTISIMKEREELLDLIKKLKDRISELKECQEESA